jgi:hypothetical protein
VRAVDLERKGSEGGAPRKRGKSGSASQILMADGAPMLGRATKSLAQEGSARLQWFGHGQEGKGQNRDGTATGVRFERKWLGGAAERGKRGEVSVGAPAWRQEKKERGGGGTDKRDREATGPSGQRWGAGGREKSKAARRQGADKRAWLAQCRARAV